MLVDIRFGLICIKRLGSDTVTYFRQSSLREVFFFSSHGTHGTSKGCQVSLYPFQRLSPPSKLKKRSPSDVEFRFVGPQMSQGLLGMKSKRREAYLLLWIPRTYLPSYLLIPTWNYLRTHIFDSSRLEKPTDTKGKSGGNFVWAVVGLCMLES